MRIAKLNQRVEVLRPVLTSDGYGGYGTVYEKETGLWVEVKESKYTGKQVFDTPNAVNNVMLKTRTPILTSRRAGIFYGRAGNMRLYR